MLLSPIYRYGIQKKDLELILNPMTHSLRFHYNILLLSALLQGLTFEGEPKNYSIIDKYLSRSAQPQKEDFVWLKEQGVTDIFNFRTMVVPDIGFDEETVVRRLNMAYHSIPSITKYPKEENVDIFLKEVEQVKNAGGKVHIHCMAGADRTGMYAYIYKSIKGIGERFTNQSEMIRMGHNLELYPDLLPWTNKLINKLLALKKQ